MHLVVSCSICARLYRVKLLERAVWKHHDPILGHASGSVQHSLVFAVEVDGRIRDLNDQEGCPGMLVPIVTERSRHYGDVGFRFRVGPKSEGELHPHIVPFTEVPA